VSSPIGRWPRLGFPAVDQQPRRGLPPSTRGEVQRRRPLFIGGRDVGSPVDQQPSNIQVSKLARCEVLGTCDISLDELGLENRSKLLP